MKIEILGSGNGFEPSLGNTSFLLWDNDETNAILMDCGYTVFSTLREMESHGRDIISKIKTVFISHLHDDHSGTAGVFTLFRNSVLRRLNRENERTRFIGTDIRPLLDITIPGCTNMYEYDDNQSDYTLIETSHGSEIPVCGILINDVMYSGDTANSLLNTEYAQKAKIIIHEATLNDGPFHTGFEKLIHTPASIKSKTWLIHNSAKHLSDGFEQLALKEGFAGICKKGKIITF